MPIMSVVATIIAGAIAACVTATAIPVVLVAARSTGVLIDLPNQRSSHREPRIRGGGLGLLLGVLTGIGVGVSLGWSPAPVVAVLIVAVVSLSIVGLFDDLWSLPVWPRLAAQVLVATWVVYEAGAISRLPLPAPADLPLGLLAVPVSVLWLGAVTNFFNFMDGIDGLAGGEAAVVALGAIVAGWSADASLLAAVLIGSTAAFLAYNWWPARIFLGDAGSIPVGFLLATLPFLAPDGRRPHALLATAVGLALFLLDPIETLARQWRRGARLGTSHRDHCYQRLIGSDDSHRAVATALICAGLLLSLAGAAAYRVPAVAWGGPALAALIYVIERSLAEARSRPVSNGKSVFCDRHSGQAP